MYGRHHSATGAKLTILIAQCLYLLASGCWLATADQPPLLTWTMAGFLAIIFFRLNAMMFFWLPRGIGWSEALGNSLAFGLYYLGFPLLLIHGGQLNFWFYGLGLIFFGIGSTLNTAAELLRKPFKADPRNADKLYRGGLFKYAIHINYFGDVLWVLGCALLTGNLYALLIPLALLALFVFSYIPTADRYLTTKYGEAFTDYQRETKELIPFVW
ncbi:methyltransferase family protein [Levilactobacillus tujiorum]|uniref:methyltransferase family protein n=1 Tax=Levilactobacillus tujiorum TaxID=2912243 RepID=UPI0014569765|nr:DUF1295 domain-containing protein [Levilactobacillus tujiorum]NLR33012.1 DUF1295 domain-containing protein [Levilactobacillus tujiorum]